MNLRRATTGHVSSTLALYECELAKHEVLADALAGALLERGLDEQRALFASRTGMAAFIHATVAWLECPDPGLADRLDLVLGDRWMLLA